MIIINAQAQPPQPPQSPMGGPLEMSDLEQTGDQAGTSPGGFFRHKTTGEEYYVKWQEEKKKQNRIKNEILAAKLYELAGIKVPQMSHVNMPDGRLGIGSKIIPNLQINPADLQGHDDVSSGFAVDAWLGNWDVTGLEFDNMKHGTEGVYRLDTGGAMLYKGQGGQKGHLFGDEAHEINSLRDPNVNWQAASVFGNIPQEKVDASIKRVLAIPDGQIRQTVMQYGPGNEAQKQQLAERLIKRKYSLNQYVSKSEHGAGPVNPSLDLPLSPGGQSNRPTQTPGPAVQTNPSTGTVPPVLP